MTFQEAKTFANLFYEEYKISGSDLNAICNSIPKTSMGLTSSEDVRQLKNTKLLRFALVLPMQNFKILINPT